IALEMMLAYPDRCYGGIMLSTMSEASDAWLRLRIKTAIWLCSKKMKSLIAWVITYGNADSRQSYKRMIREAKQGNVKNWEQYYRYSLQYDGTDRLYKISHPTLLIYGEKDKGFHRYARKLKRNIPHFTMQMLMGEKHQLPTKA